MKKTIWVGSDGEEYDTQDEAWEQACAEFDLSDFFAYIDDTMSFEEFFDRVSKMPGFWDEFERDFDNAELDYFDDNYKEKEVDVEEDE